MRGKAKGLRQSMEEGNSLRGISLAEVAEGLLEAPSPLKGHQTVFVGTHLKLQIRNP